MHVEGEINPAEAKYREKCRESREDDDELKRRVEEFIERVNEGWKAEHLSTSSLLWGENNNKELLE